MKSPETAKTALAVAASRTGAVALPDIDRMWTNRLEIVGESGNVYVVAMRRSDQTWACKCRGWIRWRNCKHLDKMLPALTAAFPGSKAATPARRVG